MTILSQEAKDKGWIEHFPEEQGWYWAYNYVTKLSFKPLYIIEGEKTGESTGKVRVWGMSNNYEPSSLYKDKYVWLPIQIPDKPVMDHDHDYDNPISETSSSPTQPDKPRLKCPHYPDYGPCELHRCKFYKHYEKDTMIRGKGLREAGHYCKKVKKWGRMNKLEEIE